MVVESDSADLYRYFDATPFVEYLYGRVADSVRRDLKEELGFVAVFDSALKGVREIVDMPDRRASLLVRLSHAERRAARGEETRELRRVDRRRGPRDGSGGPGGDGRRRVRLTRASSGVRRERGPGSYPVVQTRSTTRVCI
ncbi:hypothetical protein [Candidatus Palauibacter sp.]|uniref:hypothetical protein n=1 Tax=Candidatus Palauibacter sp. TaxID=3101350 RepID=UPI003B0118BF